jgi:hypothetical protein
MATDKKHIAVYLDPAVEQALIAFCEQKGLISKKGFMYSAGVNAALAEFFSLAGTEAGNTPSNSGNTPSNSGNTPSNSGNILGKVNNTLNDLRNIPATSASDIPAGDNIPLDTGNIPSSIDDTILSNIGNIPAKNLVVEVVPGKHHLSESEVESLRQELEEVKADRAKFLESSTYIINKLRQEVYEMTRSQLEMKFADREQVEAELSELKQNSATASRNLPEAADLLNQLKAKRKKSSASLADVELILEIIEKSYDDTPKGF